MKMMVHFVPLSCLATRQTSRPSCLFRRFLVIFAMALLVEVTSSTTRTTNSIDDGSRSDRLQTDIPRVQSETHLSQLIKAREWTSAIDYLRTNSSEASVLIERRGIDGGYSSFTGIEITRPAIRGILFTGAPNLLWQPTHPAPSGIGVARM